jgi:hypothetical protein
LGSREYIVKLGYVVEIEEDLDLERVWWWIFIWKLVCPLKMKTFMWLALANIVLTWDNRQKRNWVGPGKCILCKSSEEMVDHLFATRPFSRIVWYEVIQVTVGKIKWDKLTLVD